MPDDPPVRVHVHEGLLLDDLPARAFPHAEPVAGGGAIRDPVNEDLLDVEGVDIAEPFEVLGRHVCRPGDLAGTIRDEVAEPGVARQGGEQPAA